MWEGGQSMIGGMMGCLGEMAALMVGDQTRETVIRPGLKEANSRNPLVVADRAVDSEFQSPTVIGALG